MTDNILAMDDDSDTPREAARATGLRRRSRYSTDADRNSVYIGPRCVMQTADQRFGPGAEKEIHEALQSRPFHFADDTDESDEDSGWEDGEVDDAEMLDGETISNDGFMANQPSSASPTAQPEYPKVARLRMNLTALSQSYNLYFAAYCNKVHVYSPQAAPEILPKSPKLVLETQPHPLSQGISASQDPRRPHQINQLVVGDLGDAEILLMCYDDGDVVAYYTKHIAHYIIDAAASVRPTPPKPFFHESVGSPAWGLAIHKKSRLIAVSSNLKEVTVFACALSPFRSIPPLNKPYPNFSTSTPTTLSGLDALQLEAHLRSRDRDWRILLPLDKDGDNIPSLSFWDDERDDAEKIAAIDLKGYCYLLDIWEVGSCAVRIPPPLIDYNPRHAGWGIVVLPASDFLDTTTTEEALGVSEAGRAFMARNQGGNVINITRSLATWQNTAAFGTTHLPLGNVGNTTPSTSTVSDSSGSERDEKARSHDESDSDVGETNLEIIQEKFNERWKCIDDESWGAPFNHKIDLETEEKERMRRTMIICPSQGMTWNSCGGSSPGWNRADPVVNVDRANGRMAKTRQVGLHEACNQGFVRPQAARRLSFLAAHDTVVELLSPDPTDTTVLCEQVLPFYSPTNAFPRIWDMHYAKRMTMLARVPELAVVLVGSLSGRVAVLRLTRPAGGRGKEIRRGFRVEHILPRKEEEARGVRPKYCLLGLAVSREPEAGAGRLGMRAGGAAAAAAAGYPRRWRVLLHYMNHTLLQYTLELEGPGGEVAVKMF